MNSVPGEVWTALVGVLGAIAAIGAAVATYVRAAAKALEAAAEQRGALLTAAEETKKRVDQIEKDNNVAHARIRALEERVSSLEGALKVLMAPPRAPVATTVDVQATVPGGG